MMENALFVEWSPKGVMGAPVDDEEPQWRCAMNSREAPNGRGSSPMDKAPEVMADGVPVGHGEYPIYGEESQWMMESPQMDDVGPRDDREPQWMGNHSG